MQAKCIYMLLLMYTWQDGECWPCQARVAEAANCSVNTVEKYLKELQDYGLISWKRRGLGWPNVYGGQQIPWLFYPPVGG
ncbi:helix-turn-helix domain-containing protein [Desulfofundulus kuznetsovii]|uniref:helix-turn-helix domain-containing protein n=1 Tax=Desulfofundulus kuznetsovii TaxID=58135 RepID=UPI0002FF0C7B